MAYSDSSDHIFKISSVTALGATMSGVLSAQIIKIVERNAKRPAGVEVSAYANPVTFLGARAVIECQDISDGVGEGTAAGNVVVNFTTADGGTASATVGSMVACSQTINASSPNNEGSLTQEFEHQGSAVTWTITH